MLLLLLLVAGVTNTLAQNVTIKATNGSMIAAIKNGGTGDTFFGAGGFATWQHEQLNMVLTASDGTVLTPNAQLDNPANNLFASNDKKKIQIGKGQVEGADACYISISLPSGYRFTGYEIHFSKSGETKRTDDATINFSDDHWARFGETDESFNNYKTNQYSRQYGQVAAVGSVDSLKRSEGTGGSMGNVLYFKLTGQSYQEYGSNRTGYRALITLESAEFYFTSEENYAPVIPAGEITSPMSAVDVPFSTSKVDYGSVAMREYSYQHNGRTVTYKPRLSYRSEDVKDLDAYFTLYEEGSTKSGADFDGVTGQVVDYKAGSISSAGGYFKLGSVNADTAQVYYLETPSYVLLSDNETKNPVGYRIVEAEFDYAKSVTATRTFNIRYRYYNYNYFLNSSGRFAYTNNPTTWEMDGEGYIYTGSGNNKYYLYFNNGRAATQRQKPGSSERFGIDENNHIYQLAWPAYTIRCNTDSYGSGGYEGLISKDTGVEATYVHQNQTTASVGNFTLYLYDKEGERADTIPVTANGTRTLRGLNNDAVKFAVKGQGLVRATLTLQALDPYLSSMEVVCQDTVQTEIRLSQTFTASDFSVSGGKFHFYLPTESKGHGVKISFENLKSKYADDTYDGGKPENNARINFVKSDHYNAFGLSNNKLYNDTLEAKNASLERCKVETVGTKKFKFNNAADLSTSGDVVTEYPFTLEKYSADPNNGDFVPMTFKVTESEDSLVRYVFTTDETRYNIAPTTAIQHRAYAFYEMQVHVQTATYDPKVKFHKIYDKTLYRDKEGVKRGSFFGAEITAYDADGKPGYASTSAIFHRMDSLMKKGTDDFGATEAPDTATQLLYIDFSKLKGVYQTTDSVHTEMSSYSATNAKNCLIFVPQGSSASVDNVAYKTEGGSFHSAQNIILTDMQPFYSPYDIQVDPAYKAEYKRLITKSTYGQEKLCTLILPFNINIENGKHKNLDGSEFTLHEMQEENALKLVDGTTYAYTPTISEALTVSEPNKPYIVKLEENYDVDTLSFIVNQNGANVKATTGMNSSDYTFTGKQSSGTATQGDAEGEYTFTNKGTFAGLEVAKTQEIFYFARNRFVTSKNLDTNINTAKVAPFRAFYATKSDGLAKLMSFDVIFEEGLGDTPTGINSLGMNPDLKVVPGNGMITLTSTIEQNVSVHSTSGVMVNNTKLQAGETQTINVPAGVYVINGVKIIVK